MIILPGELCWGECAHRKPRRPAQRDWCVTRHPDATTGGAAHSQKGGSDWPTQWAGNGCFLPGRKLSTVGSIQVRSALHLAGSTTPVVFYILVFFLDFFTTFFRSHFLKEPIKYWLCNLDKRYDWGSPLGGYLERGISGEDISHRWASSQIIFDGSKWAQGWSCDGKSIFPIIAAPRDPWSTGLISSWTHIVELERSPTERVKRIPVTNHNWW